MSTPLVLRPRSESKGESVAEISEEPYDTAEEAERSAELLRAAHARLDKLFAEVMADIPSGNMDTLRTEVAALLTNLSEIELNNRRISAKSLSRLFNHKLTQSRRAASVSLEQQALKLEAQHHHSLRRLSYADGLSDMPARAETAEAACAECRMTTGSLLAALGELGVALDHKATHERVVCEVKSWLLSLRGERDVLTKNLVGSRADAQRLRIELSTLNAEKHALCAQLGACYSSMEASEKVREELQARLDAQMHAAVEAERATLVQAAQLEEAAMRAERAKLAALEHEIQAMHRTTLGIELDGALDPNAKLRELLERMKQAKEAAEARAVSAETELAAVRSQKAVLGHASLPTTEVEVPVPVQQRKLSLYEQDWQRAHRQTSEELTHCRIELATALEALAHASDELQAMALRAMRLEEVRRNERTGLAKASLSSLHQLRLHLVETLSGLRERSSGLDERHLIELSLRATAHAREETSPGRSKQRWGGVGGEFERVTVRDELPASPSHTPSGSSQGARTPLFLPQSAIKVQQLPPSSSPSSPLSSSPSARPISALTSAKLLPSHPLDSAGFISAGFTASGFMATARGQSPQSPPQTSPFTRRRLQRGARSSSCASLQSPALTSSPSMVHCLPGAAHPPHPLSLPSSPLAHRARHEHAEQRLPPSPDNPPSVFLPPWNPPDNPPSVFLPPWNPPDNPTSVFLPPWNPPGIARASEANGVDDPPSSPDVASPRGAAPAAAASRMRARSQDLDRLSTAHLRSGTRPRTALPNAPSASQTNCVWDASHG